MMPLKVYNEKSYVTASKIKDYKNKTYIGCTVCEEWHNYQNFAQWHEEHYYEVPNEIMCLDKDILIKGNKEHRCKCQDYILYCPL